MVQRFHMLYVVKKDAQSMLKEGDSALAMGHQLRLVDMKDVTSMLRREESVLDMERKSNGVDTKDVQAMLGKKVYVLGMGKKMPRRIYQYQERRSRR